MKRSARVAAGIALASAWIMALGSGCGDDTAAPEDLLAARDLAVAAAVDGPPPLRDLKGIDLAPQQPNACGGFDPGCKVVSIGQPDGFPMMSDPQPVAGQTDNGLDRDPKGDLILEASRSSFNFLWIANFQDWNVGSVSKLDSRGVREVARYFSVTCWSNAGGSRAACDGKSGCCARDDYISFTNRQAGKPAGPRQKVQLEDNSPSRTAVDYNGDVWVANRAFNGQSSVTKIANSSADCVERNGEPGIQTSSDANGDGLIDTDCNGDQLPDDVAGVKVKPCLAGRAQEFYGLDDECVLFTTNTGLPYQFGRPVALGPGAPEASASDAWAGTFQDRKFYRIDGTTGLTKAEATLPAGINPYGAAVDGKGVLWAVNLQGGLGFLNTTNPSQAGKVRSPGFTTPFGGYGIALDRDGNLWMGGYPTPNAFRYTPDRSQGFARLGLGWWTAINNVGTTAGATGNVRGVAADSRSRTAYFVWAARDGGWIVRLPASTIAPPPGSDTVVDGSGFAALRMPGTQTTGVGVDVDQHIWGISQTGSVATRIKVGPSGDMTAPDITGGTGGKGCPVGAGDRCVLALEGRGPVEPAPYTYSDFTGFGLRNFTNPRGSYGFVQPGCGQQETRWMKIVWDADVPPSTSLTVRARTGRTPRPDSTWGAWNTASAKSPVDLTGGTTQLAPNPAPFLQVELSFASTDKTASPRLRRFDLIYECGTPIP